MLLEGQGLTQPLPNAHTHTPLHPTPLHSPASQGTSDTISTQPPPNAQTHPTPPRPTEFIRMAARFGATIVPFAGIGIDDSLDLVLDSNEVERLPVLGDMVRRQAGQLPQVRRARGGRAGGRCGAGRGGMVVLGAGSLHWSGA